MPEKKRPVRRHRDYGNERSELDKKIQRTSAKRDFRQGQYWWVGGFLRKTNGDIVDACVGPYSTEQEAWDIAYARFVNGTPDVFMSKHSTTDEATREYRMRKGESMENLGDAFNRIRHKGSDIDV